MASRPAPEPDEIVFRWGGRYGLELGRVGTRWVMRSTLDGVVLIDPEQRTIRCFADRPADPDWQDVLVRRVLPRVAILFGAAATHGAAIAGPTGAVVLSGDTGAGKSTLSAACSAAGLDIFSDDIALFYRTSVPMVAPATTGVCLWPDSRAALGLDPRRCSAMPGYDGKVRFVSGLDCATDPVPLKAFVLLERSDDRVAPAIEPVSGAEALIRVAQRRIRFNPAAPREQESADSLSRIGDIVRDTPCYRLAYPSGFDRLGEAVGLMRGLLQ